MTPQLINHWVFQLDVGIVAGGFLRDRLIGIRPKDIDLFAAQGEDFAKLMKQLSRMGHVMSAKPKEPTENAYEWQIYEGMSRYGEEIDVIVRTSVKLESILSSFDFTFNQIGFDLRSRKWGIGQYFMNNLLNGTHGVQALTRQDVTDERKAEMINRFGEGIK